MSNHEWELPMSEIDFVAQRLIDKVFQGDTAKSGLARHCASVSICAVGDYKQQEGKPRRVPPLPPGFQPKESGNR